MGYLCIRIYANLYDVTIYCKFDYQSYAEIEYLFMWLNYCYKLQTKYKLFSKEND